MRFDCAESELEAGLDAAQEAIERGELVVIPTDTVYGLAADAFSHAAVQRLLDAKGRTRQMPPPVLVGAPTTLEALASDIPSWLRSMTTSLWPGPLTVICRQQPSLTWDLGDTHQTVAVRMPDDKTALALLKVTGPLAVSSANITGEPAAETVDDAERMLGDAVAVYLDGGPARSGVPSTILDTTSQVPRVLRQGSIGPRAAARVQQHDRARRRGEPLVREYLVIFGISLGVTYLLASIARMLAHHFGAVAKVRDRDVHAVPTPYFGGPAMLCGLVAAYLTATHLPFLSRSEDSVFSDARAVLIGGAVICLVGVIDDLFELDALSKFAGQVLAGVVVVALGVKFFYLPLYGSVLGLDQAQSAIFTVLLIVGTANAVNFVDGLDGLAAGMVAIGAVAFFAYAFVLAVENGESRAIAAALLTAALAGACIGMLPHNFFPARMFIGDSGSMLIGFVLACSSISLTGQFPATNISEGIAGAQTTFLPSLLPLILPIAMLLVPFVDLALAVVRRTRAGRSPFSPDKMHIHHRLLEIGHSHRNAVLVMYAIAGLVAFGTVFVSLVSGWQSIAGFFFLAALTAAFVFLLPRWRPINRG